MSLQSNPEPGRTLAQFGIAVAALVIGAAAVFWGIGLVGGGDEVAVSAPTATPTPSAAPTSEAPSVEPSTAPPSPSPTPTEEPAETEDPTETEEPSETETEEPSETETEEPSETETEEPSETETDTTDVDRSETSLQVLDAIKDGSDRAREVADDLEDDGYRLVAFGPSSIIYDNTTVFWTEGHEDEARELAESNGWDEVVFNDILSETVDVHVVVGLDEAE